MSRRKRAIASVLADFDRIASSPEMKISPSMAGEAAAAILLFHTPDAFSGWSVAETRGTLIAWLDHCPPGQLWEHVAAATEQRCSCLEMEKEFAEERAEEQARLESKRRAAVDSAARTELMAIVDAALDNHSTEPDGAVFAKMLEKTVSALDGWHVDAIGQWPEEDIREVFAKIVDVMPASAVESYREVWSAELDFHDKLHNEIVAEDALKIAVPRKPLRPGWP